MLNHPIPGEPASLPFIKSFYVREWVRYVHARLDLITHRPNGITVGRSGSSNEMSTIPEATFDPERELRDSFRRAWLLNESWRESDEEVTNYASGHHGSISQGSGTFLTT